MSGMTVLVRSIAPVGWRNLKTGALVPHEKFVEQPFSSELQRAVNNGALERQVRHDPAAKPAPSPSDPIAQPAPTPAEPPAADAEKKRIDAAHAKQQKSNQNAAKSGGKNAG